MSTEVTLTLPEPVYRSAERLAEGSQRSLKNVLTEVLSEALSAWEDERITSLDDEELLRLCDLQMSPEQSQRLSQLLEKQRERQLAEDERPELWALMRVYERALVRKSEALAEAAERGLRRQDQV
ncbi:MAG: hypothetical protein ACE5F6_17485 [Anaerolineae bacterium]